MVDKAGRRAAALARRRALPASARVEGDAARAPHLAALRGRRAAYEAFGTEPVVPLAPGDLVPVTRAERDLDWRAHPAPALLGADAVAGVDVVLVPALAVDRRGVRLGRGGGSYDRALVRARGLLVAVLHEGELVDDPLPEEPHDVRVHAVLLPSGLVELR